MPVESCVCSKRPEECSTGHAVIIKVFCGCCELLKWVLLVMPVEFISEEKKVKME